MKRVKKQKRKPLKRIKRTKPRALTFKIVRIRDLAKKMGVSEKTICLMARKGKIPAFRFGGSWRFELGILKEWIRTKALKNLR